jgi:hypothetical protein
LDVYIEEVSRSAQLNLQVTKRISQDSYCTIASLRDLGYHVNIATNEFLNKYAGFVVSVNLVANKET